MFNLWSVAGWWFLEHKYFYYKGRHKKAGGRKGKKWVPRTTWHSDPAFRWFQDWGELWGHMRKSWSPSTFLSSSAWELFLFVTQMRNEQCLCLWKHVGVLFLNTLAAGVRASHIFITAGFYPITGADTWVTLLVVGLPQCNGLMETKRPILSCFHFPDAARTLPANGDSWDAGVYFHLGRKPGRATWTFWVLTRKPCAPFQHGCQQTHLVCLYRHEQIFTVHIYGPGTLRGSSFNPGISPMSEALIFPF